MSRQPITRKRDLLAQILHDPGCWAALAPLLFRYAAMRLRLQLLCWRKGCTVREVRRIGRLHAVTGDMPAFERARTP